MIAVLSLLVLTASLHKILIACAQKSEATCLPYYQWVSNLTTIVLSSRLTEVEDHEFSRQYPLRSGVRPHSTMH